MRAIWILLITLLLVSSANAVVITCVNEGQGVMRIDYSASDEAVLPIAYAIDIAFGNGATITRIYDYKVGDSNSADPGYGIFPGSIQQDENGKIIDWGTPVLAGGVGTSSVSLGMATRYYGTENAPLVSDTLCRIDIDLHGAQDANVTITRNVVAGGVVLEDGTPAARFNGQGSVGGGGPLAVRVAKCTVKAGSKPASDSISVSGYIDGVTDGFSTAGSVAVTITSVDMVSPCVATFQIDGVTYKNGKFKGTKVASPYKATLTINTKTLKFAFTAKNVSLKGLSSPLNIEITIGTSTAIKAVDETIVNGAKTLIPLKLMMGVQDFLRIDKFTAKRSARPNRDSFTTKGGFTVLNTGVNMTNEPFVVTLGAQIFTIPAGSFKANKSGFACSRITLSDGSVASANFNFTKGTFTLTIKSATIEAGAGSADLRLNFALFDKVNTVNLPQVIQVNPPQGGGDDDEDEDDDD